MEGESRNLTKCGTTVTIDGPYINLRTILLNHRM
ncbi:hypothetical protein MTR67_002967 [Solanum verrucosum]|uniref:Uncharacterized protein n=1 Tax=Solanum verrucosum TaxID=315347 RepID=A0AAF0PRL8_SOLVR|nr:hypothetical protein MTR67_002967 [Solanum verrucosum]